MMAHRWPVCMMVAASTAIVTTVNFSLAAVDPSGFDPRDKLSGTLSLGKESGTPGTAGTDIPASANPLWAIPLGTLTATRQRPIFSSSRRPPAPPVVQAAPAEPVKAVYVPPEPEKPALSLVGVVSGISDGYAVFLSATTHDMVRLKVGEGHEGWVLRSVKAREAVLERNHRTAVIGLPTSSEETPK